MDNKIVSYKYENGIALITMNDGSKNLISPTMINEINAALDKAEKDRAVVILTGYDDIFSAGFDLKVLKTGVLNAFSMLIGGFVLSKRLLSFKYPIIIACNGHAIAMGAFLLLSGDFRIGVKGNFKIVANEVLIGLTMPFAAVELLRQRLNPAHFVRATLLSEQYNPETAVESGFLDKVVTSDELLKASYKLAEDLLKLDMKAHYNSKLRARKSTLKALKWAIRKDKLDFVLLGIRRLFKK